MVEALARLLRHETVLAFRFRGVRYDCSSRLGYLKAMLAFGLAHPDLGEDLASHLGELYRSIDFVGKANEPCAASSAPSRSAM
jgi:UTP--glucose-1-phosphate uridylyltransferase